MSVKFFVLRPPAFMEDEGRYTLMHPRPFATREEAEAFCQSTADLSNGFFTSSSFLIVSSSISI